MVSSRERVKLVLNHQEADKVPLDLGSSAVTGMHACSVYLLRQELKLDAPGTPVKVIEPYQMLGEIKPDLIEALGVDVVGVGRPSTFFGFKNLGWKPWIYFDGTPLLVPEAFNTEAEENGDFLMYPEGDKSAPPSGHLPKNGYYFDTIIRQEPIDDTTLSPEDNLEEFGPISNDDLFYIKDEIDRCYSQTDKAILANFGGTGFGDIALVPAPWMKHPKGIRDVTEWYISTKSRREFVMKVFERQCEIALGNLEKLYEAVGNKVSVAFLTGTDFGMQSGPFISPKTYRSLFMPFQKALNDWVHQHTQWKTFMHSCGSVAALIPDFIDAGFDILNPIQVSAVGMDAKGLKERFGKQIVFWGGGVDTQHALPFGTPEEVRQQVKERIKIFAPGGGFVFNTIHNLQPCTPTANILALYNSFRDNRNYPI
jgi:hypothetical protein